MADADVPITAGTGTKIDTRTVGAGTDEHRQVVVVGDPATAANVQTVSAAGAAKVDGSAVTQPVSLAAAVAIGAGAATIGTVLNVGDVDHDAVNTGKAVQVAGHASPNTTPPTAVSAAGDRVRAWYDLNGASIIRPKKSATYRAVFRLAARPYIGGKSFTANTRVQFATIHHASSATKTVRLRRAAFALRDNTVASSFAIDLVRITTAPATGNPAITPSKADSSDAAVEASCLFLPTTAGTEEAQPYASQFTSLGITAGTSSTASPPPVFPWVDLIGASNGGDDEVKLPAIRAGVLEGWAITIDSNIATTLNAFCFIEFTEEA